MSKEDGEATDALHGVCCFHSETGTEGGYWAFQETREEEIGDAWDYRGLYVLEDGDRLTIYSKDNPNEIVWSGVVKLRHYPLFTEDASGFWIHADQDGVDRETWARWFFDEYPAALIKN